MPSVYEIVTQRIIEQLEKGTAPWQKPWNVRGDAGMPHNFVTRKPYRGINIWILLSAGYSSSSFLTYKQAQDLGGNVRKGEKGLPIVFWKFGESEDKKSGEIKEWAMCRFYTVFNISQCDGIQLPLPGDVPEGPTIEPIEACESIVSSWVGCPEIRTSNRGAFYSPNLDYIGIPDRQTFKGPEEYYSTLFHEMTHSTGHKNRLNRSTINDMAPFGSPTYSREELVAEMGAAFLCGFAGIENRTIDNSAAYIANWLKVLKNDPKLVITAASHAQKACDLILGTPAFVPADKSEVVSAPLSIVAPAAIVEAPQLALF